MSEHRINNPGPADGARNIGFRRTEFPKQQHGRRSIAMLVFKMFTEQRMVNLYECSIFCHHEYTICLPNITTRLYRMYSYSCRCNNNLVMQKELFSYHRRFIENLTTRFITGCLSVCVVSFYNSHLVMISGKSWLCLDSTTQIATTQRA